MTERMTPEERADNLTDWLILNHLAVKPGPVYDKILEALKAQDLDSRKDERD